MDVVGGSDDGHEQNNWPTSAARLGFGGRSSRAEGRSPIYVRAILIQIAARAVIPAVQAFSELAYRRAEDTEEPAQPLFVEHQIADRQKDQKLTHFEHAAWSLGGVAGAAKQFLTLFPQF